MWRNRKLRAEQNASRIDRRGMGSSAILNLQFAICIFQFFAITLSGSAVAFAQDPAPPPKPPAKPVVQRLLDRTPFDQIMLNQSGGGTTIDVLPLNIPRPVPAIPATGAIKVRLLDRPTEEFEVSWANVAEIRVFEQVLLAEAKRLTAAGNFDEAYDYYARLGTEFPALEGLSDSICEYLRLNALALYQAKQHDRALALLLTLYQRNPTYAGLPGALEAVAGEVIQRYLRDGNYAAARRVLDLWQNQFKNIAPQTAATWQQRFESAAGRQVADANNLLGQKQYIAARKSVARALAIWPSLDSAGQVMAQIEREFPFVTVGVLETSPRRPTRRIDDWAAIRASALTQPLLAVQSDFGAEGGTYRSPFGEWSLDETGRELTLNLSPSTGNAAGRPTSDAIARYVLSLAAPGSPVFKPDVAALLESVSIDANNAVTLHLNRVHVRPESLLQIPLPAVPGADPSRVVNVAALYAIADHTAEQVVFTAAAGGQLKHAGPQAIVEQTMATDEAAVEALVSGDVDILDRVPPWQVERLRAVPELRVESYKLPTVHVLIPNLKQPLLAKREFRRALCFGIDRKWIVDRVLLGGGKMTGFEPVSGPFPIGISLNDPIRYGYNNQVAPRPFEPRLAAILSTIAWTAVQNPPEKNKEKDKGKPAKKLIESPIPQLTLAHPKDPVARIACQSIQMQLEREGIPIKLREFTADELLAGKVECDLRYAVLAVWEPVTDAALILGPQGLAGDLQSAYLDSALRNLSAATNWKDVRSRLAEVHEIAHHELPVIPLWQTVNFFAYRANVRGIGESPVTLYQNVEQWSTAGRDNVATNSSP